MTLPIFSVIAFFSLNHSQWKKVDNNDDDEKDQELSTNNDSLINYRSIDEKDLSEIQLQPTTTINESIFVEDMVTVFTDDHLVDNEQSLEWLSWKEKVYVLKEYAPQLIIFFVNDGLNQIYNWGINKSFQSSSFTNESVSNDDINSASTNFKFVQNRLLFIMGLSVITFIETFLLKKSPYYQWVPIVALITSVCKSTVGLSFGSFPPLLIPADFFGIISLFLIQLWIRYLCTYHGLE